MTEEETVRAVAEIQELERRAEIAYEKMYDAESYSAKDYKDDACSYLYKAGEAAKGAGLETESARLAARRAHILSVWDHQFRGVGRLDASIPRPPRREARSIGAFLRSLWWALSTAFHR
jgi:hypothetical protein